MPGGHTGRKVVMLRLESMQCDSRNCIFTRPIICPSDKFKTKSEKLKLAIWTVKRIYLLIIYEIIKYIKY